jgi:hypothetical protein
MNLLRVYLFKYSGCVLIIFLASCGNKSPQQAAIEIPPEKPLNNTESYFISDTDQLQIAAITIGEINEIHIGKDYLFRDCKDGSKCKYRDENGITVFDVNYSDDGFKIRDPEGTLMIKVKSSNGKIKIGMDEEMEDPFQIKQPSPDKASLKKSDEEVAGARMGQGALPVKVTDGKNTFYVAGPRKSRTSVVLAFPDTNIQLRIVLLTELLIREK